MRKRFASKRLRKGLSCCLLAALGGIGWGFVSACYGGPITAYRDASGRVIFVNETAPDLPTLPTSPSESARTKGTAPKRESQKAGSGRAAQGVVAAYRASWDEMIQRTADQHQVDPDLVRAVVRVESNYNPYAVSSRGARGLMQLVPATARRFGVGNVFDPKANLDGGVRYLKYLMNLFRGDLKLSLAAYNAGENAIQDHNGVPPYPETKDYLRRISELYPLSAITTPQPSNLGIDKYVDRNGIVHFSNMDLP
jgi:soluble lytic murein transglycosylase-like protein